MARADLLPPEPLQTIEADDVAVLTAWADARRDELRRLRLARRQVENEAVAAEQRLIDSATACPPAIAAAVDAMIDAAAQRLDAEVQAAKQKAMGDIAAVVRWANEELRSRGEITVLVADASWRESIAEIGLMRPRRAAELWTTLGPTEVRDDTDDVLFLGDVRTRPSAGDGFDGFWADTPDRQLALRSLRSGRRRLAQGAPA
jgi:hypothetical protein